MAGSGNGWGISGWAHLDRHLLCDLDELPSSWNRRVEHGYWLRLYRRRFLTSHEMALTE